MVEKDNSSVSTPESDITIQKKNDMQFYDEDERSHSKPFIGSESKSSSSMTSTDEQMYEDDENIEIKK